MLEKRLEQLAQLFTRSQKNTENIIKSAPIGICVTDESGNFELVNDAYCQLYGYHEEELLGQHFTMMVPEEARAQLITLHDEFLAGRHLHELRREWEVIDRQAMRHTIIAEAARIEGEDGRPRKVTFVIDITERKQLEQRLTQANQRLDHLARHDSLTGLLNRRAGLERLDEERQRAERYGNALTIASFDLDKFKAINDTHGHGIGDDVLEAVPDVMRHTLRATDILSRLGGEEFLVIMPEVDITSALQALQRLVDAIAGTSFTAKKLHLTISAGVASYSAASQRSILDQADDAMYHVKQAGGNGVKRADKR